MAQDQVPVLSDNDSVLNVPIFSLYGDHRAPSPESLNGIDVLICDLQDVGSRYYTFIWTMALAMQGSRQARQEVCRFRSSQPHQRRHLLEGPVLDLHFASFVGLYPLPVRHGMTIGEIALWLNERFAIGADLQVISMKGWKRRRPCILKKQACLGCFPLRICRRWIRRSSIPARVLPHRRHKSLRRPRDTTRPL